jgi:hypothetical protein
MGGLTTDKVKTRGFREDVRRPLFCDLKFCPRNVSMNVKQLCEMSVSPKFSRQNSPTRRKRGGRLGRLQCAALARAQLGSGRWFHGPRRDARSRLPAHSARNAQPSLFPPRSSFMAGRRTSALCVGDRWRRGSRDGFSSVRHVLDGRDGRLGGLWAACRRRSRPCLLAHDGL